MKIYENGDGIVSINGTDYNTEDVDVLFPGNTHIEVKNHDTGDLIIGRIKFQNVRKQNGGQYQTQAAFLSDMYIAFGIEQSASNGVPSGGTSGQVLKKGSDADNDTIWANTSGLPNGGTAGQVLIKNGVSNGDATWHSVTDLFVIPRMLITPKPIGSLTLAAGTNDAVILIADDTPQSFLRIQATVKVVTAGATINFKLLYKDFNNQNAVVDMGTSTGVGVVNGWFTSLAPIFRCMPGAADLTLRMIVTGGGNIQGVAIIEVVG